MASSRVPTSSRTSAKVSTKGVPSAIGRRPTPASQVIDPPVSQRHEEDWGRGVARTAVTRSEKAARSPATTPAIAVTTE